ncbi:MAG: hypothetical protein ACOYLR_13640, partial [Chlorobium sp.]
MTTSTEKVGEGRLFPAAGNLAKWPWWALTIALAAVLIVISILTTPVYQDAFNFISEGIVTTIRVTLTAYCMAIVGGLFLG